MSDMHHIKLNSDAWSVIRRSSSPYGIRASVSGGENYNRIWARDLAVTGLAILVHEKKELYAPLLNSLLRLHDSSAPNGQIPSNISIDDSGAVKAVSFGGPVGRTDCGFWWTIASVIYLNRIPDESFRDIVPAHVEKIFALAESWEFNYQGLMHLPVSSNWADEYVTGGYVLYDQLLRYWALVLAGDCFNRKDWLEKANQVRIRIKQHFCFEAELSHSLFTQAQREKLQHVSLSDYFISSFTATQIIEQYDAWSAALLILLHIPSEASIEKLTVALKRIYDHEKAPGMPAFWPAIDPGDPLYPQLLYNHSYRFKNHPGHFHNGGVWPVTNAFLVMALQLSDRKPDALHLFQRMQESLDEAAQTHPFPEYFDRDEAKPQGMSELCFSAAGYLLSVASLEKPAECCEILGLPGRKDSLAIQQKVRDTAQSILDMAGQHLMKPRVISIAGESGCGKTTLTTELENLLVQKGQKVIVLHQDDYFKLPPRQNHQQRVHDISHVGVSEVSLDLLDEHIRGIISGTVESIAIPVMNWVTDTREFTDTRVKDVDVVLVEGTYTTLLTQADLKVFMSATYIDTRQNRINRNRETVTDFIEQVLKRENQIIRTHRELANLVVDVEGRVHPVTNLDHTGAIETGTERHPSAKTPAA